MKKTFILLISVFMIFGLFSTVNAEKTEKKVTPFFTETASSNTASENGVSDNHFEGDYWYEDGVRQGVEGDPKNFSYDGTERGREIYDPETDGWYWLDANAEGKKAVSKEVFMPYVFQDEEPGSTEGKWVRYDENGKMYKGWVTLENWTEKPEQNGNRYYYDLITGAMAKGEVVIEGQTYNFDPITGVLQ